MNYEDISDKLIRDFLLGGLDESAAERLDELSITNAGFADRLAVERYELMDDWVAGRLEGDDRKRFEAMLARSPTLREQVEIGRGLATTARRAVVVERSDEPSFFAGLFAGWPRFAFAGAGLVVLIGIVGLAVFVLRDSGHEVAVVDPSVVPSPTASPAVQSPTPSSPAGTSPTATPANVQPTPTPTSTRPTQPTFATLVLAPPMRGSTAVRTVKLEQATEFLNLTLQTEADSSGRFVVQIGDASGGTDWQSGAVRGRSANGRTSVSVRVPAAKLKNGIRSVRLVDAGSGSEVLDEHAIKIER